MAGRRVGKGKREREGGKGKKEGKKRERRDRRKEEGDWGRQEKKDQNALECLCGIIRVKKKKCQII